MLAWQRPRIAVLIKQPGCRVKKGVKRKRRRLLTSGLYKTAASVLCSGKPWGGDGPWLPSGGELKRQWAAGLSYLRLGLCPRALAFSSGSGGCGKAAGSAGSTGAPSREPALPLPLHGRCSVTGNRISRNREVQRLPKGHAKHTKSGLCSAAGAAASALLGTRRVPPAGTDHPRNPPCCRPPAPRADWSLQA